jgi:hypothetical protein
MMSLMGGMAAAGSRSKRKLAATALSGGSDPRHELQVYKLIAVPVSTDASGPALVDSSALQCTLCRAATHGSLNS